VQKIGLRSNDFPFVKPIRFINDTNASVACSKDIGPYTRMDISVRPLQQKITVDVSRFVMLKYAAAVRISYRSRISNAKDDVSKNILLEASSLIFIEFFSSSKKIVTIKFYNNLTHIVYLQRSVIFLCNS